MQNDTIKGLKEALYHAREKTRQLQKEVDLADKLIDLETGLRFSHLISAQEIGLGNHWTNQIPVFKKENDYVFRWTDGQKILKEALKSWDFEDFKEGFKEQLESAIGNHKFYLDVPQQGNIWDLIYDQIMFVE